METISGNPTPAHAFVNDEYKHQPFPTTVYKAAEKEGDPDMSKIVKDEDELDAAIKDGYAKR